MNSHHRSLRFGRRVRRPESGRIPVVILTGFLGAGKTSLIRRTIDTAEGAGTAIITNEFGEIGIDQALLSVGDEKAALLGNGCLCCTARSDLQETMRALITSRREGAVSFRQVIIETSGLADPGPLLQTFATDRALADEFHLRALVTVIDPLTFDSVTGAHPLARKQIALADRAVISKTDIASADQVEAVRQRVLAEIPGRPVILSRMDDPQASALLAEDLDLGARSIPLFAEAAEHVADISSYPFFFDEPIVWDAFVQAMRALVQLRGDDLLRVKGLVAVRGCAGPVLFHCVQNYIHNPVELEDWPDDDRRSRLVFITRNIRREQVAALFAAMTGMMENQG